MDSRRLKKQREAAAKLSRPRPIELPSGKWRCQIMVGGRRIDVIEDDPAVAHAKALALKTGLMEEDKSPREMTVGEAIDRYIESKDAVLSPSTIRGYRKLRENALQPLMGIRLPELTQEAVQKAVNLMAKDKSPKSVRNAHGLLSAALSVYRSNMVLRTTLPQKQRYEAKIPSEQDIENIMAAAKGTRMELPVLLAIWMGLRASEIRGITWSSIEGNLLHIKQAIVQGDGGPTIKGTKTYSGNRRIRIPPYILQLIEAQPHIDDYVVHMSGQAMYKAFCRMCERAGLPHYRFHDLRHGNASVMLALGIPDKYAMERMGHATNNMLKTVYQHTMDEKRQEVDDTLDNYFSQKLYV
ncbi:MAG: site-specific integrase [Provencibacterium sp.]|nr:site-specific integrase [Provencibacterium sp.]